MAGLVGAYKLCPQVSSLRFSPLPFWVQPHRMLQPVRQAMATRLKCSATEPLAISPSADFGDIMVFAAAGGQPYGGIPVLAAVGGEPSGGPSVLRVAVGGQPIGGLPIHRVAVGGQPFGGIPVLAAVGGEPSGRRSVLRVAVGGQPIGGLPIHRVADGGQPFGGVNVICSRWRLAQRWSFSSSRSRRRSAIRW